VPIGYRKLARPEETAPGEGAPDPFEDGFLGLIAARAVGVATSLGVFDALAEASASPGELAERLDLDPLGSEVLLTALLALGYVERDGERYRPTEVAARLLVRSSPESIATFVGAQNDLHWDVLTPLADAVRTGRAYRLHEERRDDPAWEAYIRGLFEISRGEQDANAALVPVEDPTRMVDVAGGHGGFAMAMCRRHPSLHATVLDLPPAVAVGRRIVAEEGMSDRVSFREGDVFETDLGSKLDVVSAFNLVHHLPHERNLEFCRRAKAALRPGGCLVIGDSERPEPGAPVSQTGALSGLLFYAWSHGRTYTASELGGLLTEAGFVGVEAHRNERSAWRVVLIGRI
jgi:SAM-dependent methyltransferase